MTEYWFARYRVGPKQSRGLTPIAWQGWAIIAGFVGAMLLGGLSFVTIATFTPYFPLGIAIFVICAFGGGCTFIWAATTKSDPIKTAADYQAAKP